MRWMLHRPNRSLHQRLDKGTCCFVKEHISRGTSTSPLFRMLVHCKFEKHQGSRQKLKKLERRILKALAIDEKGDECVSAPSLMLHKQEKLFLQGY